MPKYKRNVQILRFISRLSQGLKTVLRSEIVVRLLCASIFVPQINFNLMHVIYFYITLEKVVQKIPPRNMASKGPFTLRSIQLSWIDLRSISVRFEKVFRLI